MTPRNANEISTMAYNELLRTADFITKNPNVILTEGDLQGHLFSNLLAVKSIGLLERTLDGKKSISLHSEVSYFGDNGKLENRVDLAVVDVADLDTYADKERRNGGRYGKSYAFEGSALAIELKVNRKGSKDSVKKGLEKDLIKLNRLSVRNPSTHFVSFFYDKRGHLEHTELDKISHEYPAVTVIYVTKKGKYVFKRLT